MLYHYFYKEKKYGIFNSEFYFKKPYAYRTGKRHSSG